MYGLKRIQMHKQVTIIPPKGTTGDVHRLKRVNILNRKKRGKSLLRMYFRVIKETVSQQYLRSPILYYYFHIFSSFSIELNLPTLCLFYTIKVPQLQWCPTIRLLQFEESKDDDDPLEKQYRLVSRPYRSMPQVRTCLHRYMDRQ